MIDTVKRIIVDEKPTTFADCVEWSRKYFQTQYGNKIKQLLFNFPADSVRINIFK